MYKKIIEILDNIFSLIIGLFYLGLSLLVAYLIICASNIFPKTISEKIPFKPKIVRFNKKDYEILKVLDEK